MIKEQLMQLAGDYKGSASEIFSKRIEARQALSNAIDAALKQVRSDALEEAAEVCEETHDSHVKKNAARATAYDCASAIRALKEQA